MDLDILRSAVTLLSFLTFAGIVAWALSPRKRADFAEAEQLPFLEAAEFDGETRMSAPGRSEARMPQRAARRVVQ